MNTSKAWFSEMAVMGCLLTDPDAWEEIAGELKADDFHIFHLKRCFVAITQMKEKDSTCAIDMLTVTSFIHVDQNQNESDVQEKNSSGKQKSK